MVLLSVTHVLLRGLRRQNQDRPFSASVLSSQLVVVLFQYLTGTLLIFSLWIELTALKAPGVGSFALSRTSSHTPSCCTGKTTSVMSKPSIRPSWPTCCRSWARAMYIAALLGDIAVSIMLE